MKKAIQFFAILIISLIYSHNVSAFSGAGSGAPDDPYVITDVNQLQEMQDGLNACYILGNDVDAGPQSWNNVFNFHPVGDEQHSFIGIFDGQGHTISNLYVKDSMIPTGGLFGTINNATIQNVTLMDANVSTNSWGGTGSLAGHAKNSFISNCHSIKPFVNSSSYIGGLIGLQDGGTIISCSVDAPTILNGQNCGGLAGQINNSTSLIDCKCLKVNISGSISIGGLVGYSNYSNISDCASDGSVNSTDYQCGGLVGEIYGGNITNCHSSGYVTGIGSVGGLAGYVYDDAIISNSTSDAEVTATDTYCGGLIGNFGYYCTATNCHSTGRVVGNDQTGGLIGQAGGGSILNRSYATGNVTGNDDVGGLIGYNNSQNLTNCYSSMSSVAGASRVGGLLGNNNYGTTARCFSASDVNSSGDDGGGFVGINSSGTITDCFATGSVKSSGNFIGGFMGEATQYAATNNCYSAGLVNAAHNSGGFAGYNAGTSNDCFWDKQTSGKSISACGTGKTTSEMKQQITFDPPWNFTLIWGIKENITYPYLIEMSPMCGDPWHPYPTGDLNFDCRVDFQDFSVFTSRWLECTAPECE